MADGEPLRVVNDGVIIAIRLQPGAGADRIDGVETAADGAPRLKVRVTAAAEKGRANAALVGLLARSAGVAKSACAVIAGEKQRNKKVLVRGAPDALAGRLRTWLGDLSACGSRGRRT